MASMIDELAKSLGVSNATISRALNDKPGVGVELRARIIEKARELNYTPSFAARALAANQTFTIGFFVREKADLPSAKDPFYYEIQQGAEAAVANSNYHISVAALTDDILARPQDFRFTRERRIDGMILAGPDIPADFIMAMLRTQIPVVMVDNRLNQTPINAINSDDEGGAYNAANYLLEMGHSSIGVISGPKHWPSNARRLSGYTRALAEAGLKPHVVHADRTTIDSGISAYHALIEQQPHITALCAINDSMAIGAIRAADKLGQRVPDDLSVIGFDDIEWAEMNTPPLTTMRIPKPQIGKEAARRMLVALEDPDLLPSEIILPVNLIERESVKAYRQR